MLEEIYKLIGKEKTLTRYSKFIFQIKNEVIIKNNDYFVIF